jgi:hypothetical protein
MALFNECMQECAQKVFDTADIVRDGICNNYAKRMSGRDKATMASTEHAIIDQSDP